MLLVFTSLETLQVLDLSTTRKINYPQRSRAACWDSEDLAVEVINSIIKI